VPLEERAHTDTAAPLGATACYVVRAVASVRPLIESAPSNESCVGVRDIAAPVTPAGLAILPRENGLEVLWSPSPEPDLAGYRLYRAAGEGTLEKLAELPPGKTGFLDESAQKGVVYRYSLSAFDQAGNESPPSPAVEGTLP
jgi:fibronectin type 3 domain-containing protein